MPSLSTIPRLAAGILAAALIFVLPADGLAQDATTYADDGIYQTYDDAYGSTTYGSDGEVWQTYDDAYGSTTYDPYGGTWQTYDDAYGSTTYGPDGGIYQTYDDYDTEWP